MIEEAVFFPTTSPSLVGVFTMNEGRDRNGPAGVFINAGLLHRVGPNRLYVRMARELARHGFSSLRFDLSGIGDSFPRTDSLAPRASALRDVSDAVDFISSTRALSRFILIGLCSGADLAYRAALADTRVVGVILIDALPYRTVRSHLYGQLQRVGHLIRRRELPSIRALHGGWRELSSVFRPAPTTDKFQKRDIPSRVEAAEGLRDLAERGVRVLIIYTDGRGYTYRRQFANLFRSVPRQSVQVEYFKGVDHTFNLLASQDRLVRTIGDWTSNFF